MDDSKYLAKCCMFDMLMEVDRICRNNNIKYTLSNGTLMGAIKYKGFIPWDDDLDIAFLREEYEKFIDCCKKELNDNYRLTYAKNESGNPNYYHKIKIAGSLYTEEISRKSDANKEIYIDILPYDQTSNYYIIGCLHHLVISFYRRLLGIKCGYDFSGNKNIIKRIANFVLTVFSNMMTKEKIMQRIEKKLTKYSDSNTKYVINEFGPYSFKKERMKKKLFSGYSRKQFELGKFYVAVGYDEILKTMYGDYMNTLPPASEQVGRHKVMNFSLGGYKIKNYLKGKK